MHEMSLCEGVLQVLEEQARAQQYQQVRRVRLEIGALACVDTEAMRFCFDVVCRNTLAEGSVLEISRPDGAAWCMACATTVAIKRRGDACPQCGSYQLQVTAGEELKISELEVD